MSEERKGVGRWFGQSEEQPVAEQPDVTAEPVLPDVQVYQEPEADLTPVAEPVQSDPDNELVVVELVGGDRDNVNTRYGTFSRGVSVELNRRMADELLQLRDGNEPLFQEV